MIKHTEAEQSGRVGGVGESENDREVDEKELVAGGRRVRQGNAPPSACTNKHYLAPIDRELSRAEQPVGRLRRSCLHLQKKKKIACARRKIVLHPPRDSHSQGRGARHANRVAAKNTK